MCILVYNTRKSLRIIQLKFIIPLKKEKTCKRFHLLQGSGKCCASHEIFTCIAVQQQRLICITHRKTGNIRELKQRRRQRQRQRKRHLKM